MNSLRTLFLLGICCLMISGCFDKSTEDQIVVGLSSDYPPFEFQESGKIVGFDVDLAQEIADRLGKKLVIKDMVLYGLVSSLQNGKLNLVISGISPTDARQNLIGFSDIYYKSKMAFVFNDQKISLEKFSDLDGKTVGAQSSSTMENYLNNQEDIKDIHILSQDNNNQLMEYLKIGKVDAVLMDLEQALAFSKISSHFKIFSFNVSDAYGFAIAMQKKDEKLKKNVNAIIGQMKSDGTLQKLEKKWLSIKDDVAAGANLDNALSTEVTDGHNATDNATNHIDPNTEKPNIQSSHKDAQEDLATPIA